MSTASHRGRRQSRRVLLQALYQWQMANGSFNSIKKQFEESGSLRTADQEFFDTCLLGVLASADDLDRVYEPHMDRAVESLDYVERGVLRAGTFELLERRDVPYRVVINEWVSLTKSFGATDSFRYVNGVLDAVAHQVRDEEH